MKSDKPTRRPSALRAPRARDAARAGAGKKADAPTRAEPKAKPKARAAPRASRVRAGVKPRMAKFTVGQVVRHRYYPFRGVIFDIDPVFSNTEEWWQSIPEEIRPSKNQPFYHLLAENADTEYIAYVSEQNLLLDESGTPLRNPKVAEMFAEDEHGHLKATFLERH